MNKYSIFYSVSENDFDEIKKCLSTEKKVFTKNDIILRYSDNNNNIGIINKGVAFLLSINENGETSIIDYYEKGNAFGKIFAPDPNVNFYYILAKTDCEIIFIDYSKLTNSNDEIIYQKIVHKLILNSFKRCNMHIDVLSCRSIREKLLKYIKYMRYLKNSDEFTINISLSDLADYLSVDRSAMMREIKKMKDENLIIVKGSHITAANL